VSWLHDRVHWWIDGLERRLSLLAAMNVTVASVQPDREDFSQ